MTGAGRIAEAREALSDLEDSPVCSVLLAEVPRLTVVWKRQATSKQLRAVLERPIEFLREYRTTRSSATIRHCR